MTDTRYVPSRRATFPLGEPERKKQKNANVKEQKKKVSSKYTQVVLSWYVRFISSPPSPLPFPLPRPPLQKIAPRRFEGNFTTNCSAAKLCFQEKNHPTNLTTRTRVDLRDTTLTCLFFSFLLGYPPRLQTKFSLKNAGSISKRSVYEDYLQMCQANNLETTSAAVFGKLLHKAFPSVKTTRKGPRGAAKHHYKFLGIKDVPEFHASGISFPSTSSSTRPRLDLIPTHAQKKQITNLSKYSKTSARTT